MNRESRAVIHYGNWLGGRSRAQRFKQFGDERLELFELDQNRVVGNFSRRQIDWIVRLEQQPRLGLMVAFLGYRHRV